MFSGITGETQTTENFLFGSFFFRIFFVVAGQFYRSDISVAP